MSTLPARIRPFTLEEEAARLTELLPRVNREAGGQHIAVDNGVFVWVTKRKRLPLSIHFYEVSRFIKQICSKPSLNYEPSDDKKRRKHGAI